MSTVTAKIIRPETGGRRILVTSDVHGHLSHLKALLEKAAFCGSDLLILAGDLLDKGSENLAALRYVMSLCREGNVIPLMGNSDLAQLRLLERIREENAPAVYADILQMRQWYGTCFFEELAASCGCSIASPEDVPAARDRILADRKEEIGFLSALPTVAETENFVFVHGGLREKAAADNAGRTVHELTKYDAFAENTPHVFDKYVVCGHWPVNLYSRTVQQLNPVIDREKHIISIDGGCGTKRREEQLNLLVIPHAGCSVEEVSFLSFDVFPTVRALEDQSAGAASLHINWVTRDVQILQPGAEFTEILHLHSGRKLSVPTSRIYGGNKCDDYTDHRLPVRRGDVLSLLEKTSRGIICKKDGVVGWYCGAYGELP